MEKTSRVNRVRHLAVPHLVLAEGTEFYVKFLSPFEARADEPVEPRPGRKPAANLDDRIQMAPPMVARVEEYDMYGKPVGVECTMIGGTVLLSTLDRAYPDNGYVGRFFAITKLPKEAKRSYAKYLVDEIAFN